MTEARNRVALVNDAGAYVGPAMAREFARRGHDLVVGTPPRDSSTNSGTSAPRSSLSTASGISPDPDSAPRLVSAALEHFGHLDAAAAFTGQIVNGRFMRSTIEDLRKVVSGCLEGPYHFLKAVAAPMIDAGGGQIVLITSAAGARPTPGVPLYSAVRAGATMMARNLADEIARTGVQVNALGTNFMDFPGFHEAAGTNDPEVRSMFEAQVPMRRFGTMEEFAAFSMAFLDGTSGFTTGQFVAYAGGWV